MLDRNAIIAGIIVSILVGLIGQLFFVLAAAEIGNAEGEFFTTYKEQLWFIIGLFSHCITMVISGAVVAFFASEHIPLNAAVAGALGSFVSITFALGAGFFTLMSIFMVAIGTLFAVIGALIWSRYYPAEEEAPAEG